MSCLNSTLWAGLGWLSLFLVLPFVRSLTGSLTHSLGEDERKERGWAGVCGGCEDDGGRWLVGPGWLLLLLLLLTCCIQFITDGLLFM